MGNFTIDITTVTGSSVRLVLPAAGAFASAFVLSMEATGSAEFWQLLAQLMQAAGRSAYAFDEDLRARGLHFDDIAEASARELLSRDGQVFGIFRDISPGLRDMLRHRQKILFLRDPRYLLVARYRDAHERARRAFDLPGSDAVLFSFNDFLFSAEVAQLLERYRDFVEIWQQDGNAVFLRYEHALADWRLTAAHLVAALSIPIDPLTAAAIAEAATPLGDRLWPRGQMADVELTAKELDQLNTLCTYPVVALGYQSRHLIPARPAGPPNHEVQEKPAAKADATSAAPASEAALQAVPGCGTGLPSANLNVIFEPDPGLLMRLKANARAGMSVLGRIVTMDVDREGRRPVIGQPPTGVRTLAAFGCSCTYGIAVPADETFCSVLQGMFLDWRVENHGIAGYCTLRNLIQLERHARWHEPEYVTFCWTPQHPPRSVADINWVRLNSEHILQMEIRPSAQMRLPRAVLARDGTMDFQQVRIPHSELVGVDMSDLAIDPYHADDVCFRLLKRANAIVAAYGGHFFVTTLVGQPSAILSSRLAEAGVPVVVASVEGSQYSCLPDDPHPNALAHGIYAERIRDYLRALSSRAVN